MSDKLKQLEIKKLLSEYETTMVHKEIKEEFLNQNEKSFKEAIANYLGDTIKDITKSKDKPTNTNKSKVEKIIEDDDMLEGTKSNLKKMFRQIVKKTHPDKVNSEELIYIYIKSKEAYDKNDILSIAHYSKILNIDIELDDDDINMLQTCINNINKKLIDFQKSWIYIWGNLETEEKKEKVIQLYCTQFHNYNIVEKKYEKMLVEIYKISPYSKEYTNKTNTYLNGSPTYGETTQEGVDEIVKHFNDYFNEKTVFYDLGCGLGKMVAHIGIQYNVKKSCGIELSKERLKCAHDIKERYCKNITNVSFIESDFFKTDLSDATVVYFDNTSMYESKYLIELVNKLPKGCLVLTRSGFMKSEEVNKHNQKLVKETKFNTTYGRTQLHYLIT